MFEKAAVNITRRMAEENMIEKGQEEYYIYAIVTQGEQLVTISTILLISLFIDEFVPTVMFLVFFLSLRKRTGGYHFKSFIRCYIGTVVTYVIVVYISRVLISHFYILLFILLLSICIIGVIGTVNHPNMHMNIEELAESKRAARISVLLESTIIFFAYLMGVNITCIGIMAVAVILCAILLCLAKIVKQEVKENEENQ